MKRLLILGAFLIAFHSSSFGQDKEWKTLTKDSFSIQYPDNWNLDETGQMGSTFILFSPLAAPSDPFRENVNLLIQDLTGYNLDLDRYVELSENQIKTMINDGRLIESTRINDKTLEYHKIIYQGNLNNRDLKFEQYYWVQEKKAYVLTLTCEKSEFDNYKLTGEKILNSFTLSKK